MDARRVYSAQAHPEHLRRVRFKDPESGKTLVFLTNNTALPALTIAALYKSRWQVELFKWIKQHLRIKRFLGTSENAVKTQIWCAVSTYVLIAIVKKELHLEASLYTADREQPARSRDQRVREHHRCAHRQRGRGGGRAGRVGRHRRTDAEQRQQADHDQCADGRASHGRM